MTCTIGSSPSLYNVMFSISVGLGKTLQWRDWQDLIFLSLTCCFMSPSFPQYRPSRDCRWSPRWRLYAVIWPCLHRSHRFLMVRACSLRLSLLNGGGEESPSGTERKRVSIFEIVPWKFLMKPQISDATDLTQWTVLIWRVPLFSICKSLSSTACDMLCNTSQWTGTFEWLRWTADCAGIRAELKYDNASDRRTLILPANILTAAMQANKQKSIL